MKEATWHNASKPEQLLQAIAGLNNDGAQDRKLRLFACACVRRHWKRFTDERDRRVIELAEDCADGKVNIKDLEAARDMKVWARPNRGPDWAPRLACAAHDCAKKNAQRAAVESSHQIAAAAGLFATGKYPVSMKAMNEADLVRDEEKKHQLAILLDLFGDPFRPVNFSKSELKSKFGKAVALARTMYDERDFARMPDLGRLLKKAGCTDERILAHCQSAGPHHRGCWVVDLLLGKHVLLDPTPKPQPKLLPENDGALLPYETYVVLWSQDRCQCLEKDGQLGTKPKVLFGGPHTSHPSLSRFHIKEGDYIIPIGVTKGIVHLIGRMRVNELLPLDEHVKKYPKFYEGCYLKRAAESILDQWVKLHPELRYLVWSCTYEVASVDTVSPLRLDRAMPAEVLERLIFKAGKKESNLRGVMDGKLMNAFSLQGLYRRLSKQSALEVEALFKDDSSHVLRRRK